MNDNPRFIRVRGRIVPMRTKKEGSHAKSAALGAVIGATTAVAETAKQLGAKVGNVKAVRTGKALAFGVTAAALGSTILNARAGYKTAKKEGTFSGVKRFVGLQLSSVAGQVGGGMAFGTYAGVKIAKGSIARAKLRKTKKIGN